MKSSAEVLSKILLMQNMLAKLPGREAVFSFVCRGIEEMPGVDRVSYLLDPVPPKVAGPEVIIFPVYLHSDPIGFITIRLENPQAFQPYSVYINNICYMMAALFRERYQQLLDEERQAVLERMVADRTAQLSDLIRREEAAREQAERYLQVAEAIILELSPDGRVEVINNRGAEVLGYPRDEIVGRDWFELAITPEKRPEIRRLFREALNSSPGERHYNEDLLVTADGETRYIYWISVAIHDAAGNVKSLLNSGQDITERRNAEDQTRRALRSNEILLKELYHRTRNNMQVISSLLTLQAAKISDPRLQGVLRDIDNRIRSIALIHQKLYDTGDLTRLRLDNYIEELTMLLIRNYKISDDRIQLDLELDPVEVEIETALPFGLLANEILSNCLKYAFPAGREGTLKITLKGIGESGMELVIADDGIGIGETGDFFSPGASLGGYLIKSITEEQLSGSVAIDNDSGTRFRIEIPLRTAAKNATEAKPL